MSKNMQRVGIVGAGQMGSNLALLFADHDYLVSAFDVCNENIKKLGECLTKHEEMKKKIQLFTSMQEFMTSFQGHKRVLILSITHGRPVDEVLEKMSSLISEGDIVLDGGNEWYLSTERRQEAAKKKGYHLLSLGVSGGYQSARRGPSLTPSGERSAYSEVESILKKIAAKDAQTGEPCVDYIGRGGSGHYVKMVHNGIEQGCMGVVCEAYQIMRHVFGLSHEAAGQAFAEWNSKGELLNNFLVEISSEIVCRKVDGNYLLDKIEDKVVQDADDTEGTGVWSVKEAAERHIGCPTIAYAHFMRVLSAHRDDREITHSRWKTVVDDLTPSRGPSQKEKKLDNEKLEHLRLATYAGILASFLQGFNLIAKASHDMKWTIHMLTLIKCWKNGCIIRSDNVMEVLKKAYANDRKGEEPTRNICAVQSDIVAKEVNKSYAALKSIVLLGIEGGAHVPTLAASLEYFKVCASTDLPTRLMEAQLDFFGGHNYNLVSEHNLDIKKGPHHFEWRHA